MEEGACNGVVEGASDEERASGGKKEVVRDGVEERASDCVQEVVSDGMDEGINVEACDEVVELGCRDECNMPLVTCANSAGSDGDANAIVGSSTKGI